MFLFYIPSNNRHVGNFCHYLLWMRKYNPRWDLADSETHSLSTWNSEDFVGYTKIENVYSKI